MAYLASKASNTMTFRPITLGLRPKFWLLWRSGIGLSYSTAFQNVGCPGSGPVLLPKTATQSAACPGKCRRTACGLTRHDDAWLSDQRPFWAISRFWKYLHHYEDGRLLLVIIASESWLVWPRSLDPSNV